MPNSTSCSEFLWKVLHRFRRWLPGNLRGAAMYPPGHFYSPLIDLTQLSAGAATMPFDGVEYWEHIDLRPTAQQEYFAELLERFPFLAFPKIKSAGFRYFTEQDWFVPADAFTLSGIIQKEKPRRIVEVGSGFSSAVMLDTLERTQSSAQLTFIEPYPERVHRLLSPSDRAAAQILVQRVQEVPLDVFDQLEAQDLLVIDSSHVAKVGSDVSFLLLRILPRLQPGVFVHFHDLFYPASYPASWVREGRAWNESLFLRAFLLGNPRFQIIAFNAFVGFTFPELFRAKFPAFLQNTGGSLWLQKTA